MREIPLTRGLYAVVDDDDYPWLSQFNWSSCTGKKIYAARNGEDGRTIYMHREIMRPPEGMEVDHRDGFTLRNVRLNLRICTVLQNHQNRRQGLQEGRGFGFSHGAAPQGRTLASVKRRT